MSRVTVIDYGLGNLHSVEKALRHVGAEVEVSDRPQQISQAELLVLPGVGAFSDGMNELRSRELVEPIHQFVASGRPLLGICLGMQLLLGHSEEFGDHAGLGLIPGRVTQLHAQPGWKIPHVGWNRLVEPAPGRWRGTLLEDFTSSDMVYFVHSFVAEPAQPVDRLAVTPFGELFATAAVQHQNLTGFQFHPEKSGQAGLAMLKKFVAAR